MKYKINAHNQSLVMTCICQKQKYLGQINKNWSNWKQLEGKIVESKS